MHWTDWREEQCAKCNVDSYACLEAQQPSFKKERVYIYRLKFSHICMDVHELLWSSLWIFCLFQNWCLRISCCFLIRLRNSESSATRSNTLKFEVVPWSVSAIVLWVKEPAARMLFNDDHIPPGTSMRPEDHLHSGYKPARDQHHKERNTCEQECGHHCKLVNTRYKTTFLHLSYAKSFFLQNVPYSLRHYSTWQHKCQNLVTLEVLKL